MKLTVNVGDKFGKLTVLYENGRTKYRDRKWYCICECGNFVTVAGGHLRTGHTHGCGCTRGLIHGHLSKYKTNEPDEYGIWVGMKSRCNNPKEKAYKNYGAKGIKVCERWENNFDNFFSDMGVRPTKDHSIERIDSTKGYSLENCKWATRKEQNRNTNRNVFITYNNIRLCRAEWAELLGIANKVFSRKPPEEAINHFVDKFNLQQRLQEILKTKGS